jgi:hypothetical protein
MISCLIALNVSGVEQGLDHNGDLDVSLCYGGWSLSIWTEGVDQICDREDPLEQSTAAAVPSSAQFTSTSTSTTYSLSNGPEPEGLAIGIYQINRDPSQ